LISLLTGRNKLRAIENKVPRRAYAPKWEEVTGR
jgi:hypothetical protein